MKTAKKIISLFLVCFMLLSLATPVFAITIQKDKKITSDDAVKAALDAAKIKFYNEKIPFESPTVTIVKYDKNNKSYSVTIRSDLIYKYTCTISVRNFMGNELAYPEDSEITEQSKFVSYFSQFFEKAEYFLIRIFNK